MPDVTHNSGFTLIEMLLTIAIISILAVIVYPSYHEHMVEANRTKMMTELHHIAGRIQARKLSQGSYKDITLASVHADSHRDSDQEVALYTISMTKLDVGHWHLAATPITSTKMDGDGQISLDYQGIKCRKNSCGYQDEWRR